MGTYQPTTNHSIRTQPLKKSRLSAALFGQDVTNSQTVQRLDIKRGVLVQSEKRVWDRRQQLPPYIYLEQRYFPFENKERVWYTRLSIMMTDPPSSIHAITYGRLPRTATTKCTYY